MTAAPHSHHVAVVGLACRLPGAANAGEFWHNLRGGVESIAYFEDDELMRSGVPVETRQRSDYVPAKAVLEGVDLFDAGYFGLTPREAELMDPQHRLFLECAHEALENSGYDFHDRDARVGVYGGCAASTWFLTNILSRPDVLHAAGALPLRLGNGTDFLASQVSYRLNLRGPSVTVQSACSTALVAVHLACQALLDGECDMAMAGGVAVSFPVRAGYLFQEGGIWSPDGHCRPFDASGHGTVEGNGAGVVVLKRVRDAIADGDPIRAVIRGSAVNNDGAFKAGYAAPSIDAQSRVVLEALAMAEVHPDTIGYVEAHGSGTALGDPIEVRALTQAFRPFTERQGFCWLGSVKSNIGHLDNAAGIASLIKTILALEHGEIPQTLHFTAPNPQLALESSPFAVNNRLVEWTRGKTPRRAGVSSLGIGGTNVHVVLEEAPAPASAPPDDPAEYHVLTVSARTPEALDVVASRIAEHLAAHPAIGLANVSYTLTMGRRQLGRRRAVVAATCREAEEALRRSPGQSVDAVRDRPVAFLFPGLGDQGDGVAAGLYRSEPGFRARLDHCADVLKPLLGVDIRESLFASSATGADRSAGSQSDRMKRWFERAEPSTDDPLAHTLIAQPALFAIEHSLTGLLADWRIEPAAMIGYSLGEYVAACVAGVLSLEDALSLVATRARLIASLSRGGMLAVPLSRDEVADLIDEPLSIAVSASPAMTVVGGAAHAIGELEARLADRGVASLRLSATHAFHSAMMDPVVEPFQHEVKKITLRLPRIPYVSNVSGDWISAADATDPGYWARHLRQTVRFADGLEKILAMADVALLEVGPGQALTTLVRQHPLARRGLPVLPAMRDRHDQIADGRQLRVTLGRLWESGVNVRWEGYWKERPRHRVALPSYPFERTRCWIEPGSNAARDGSSGSDQARADIADWFYVPAWHQAPMPVRSSEGPQRWLVFEDDTAVGARLGDALRARGHQVIAATPAADWRQVSEDRFEIHPARGSDYAMLLRAASPDRVVHLWSLTAAGAEPWDSDRGFKSLLCLAQAMGEHGRNAPRRIDVVSSHVHDVDGQDRVDPRKGTILGPVKVIPQEYAGVTCRSIDLGGVMDENRDRVCESLTREVLSDAPEQFVSWRGRRRLSQRWVPVRIDRPLAVPARLRDEGVYLIAGGLEPTGLAVAEHLSRRVRARLVLTGPASFPPRDKWERWLQSHDDLDRIARSIRRLRALELSTRDLLIRTADIFDARAMRDVVTDACARFGRIDGVVHAAGPAGAGLIQLKTSEATEAVMAPKLVGAPLLRELTADLKLDFVLLFSSLTAVAGGVGQVDTCAAGAFLGAFASRASAGDGGFTATIDWCPFEWDAWTLPTFPGRGTEPSLTSALQTSAIGAAAVADVFDRVLAAGLPRVAVSPFDLGRVLEQTDAMTTARLVESISAPRDSHARPRLAVAYQEARTATERTVAGVWAESFGLETVGVNDGFFDLAGNSLLAIQIVTRLRTALGVDLSIAALFESPTVAGLAEHIDRLLNAGELEALLDEIEKLSPEDVEARLADDDGPREGPSPGSESR
jgi:acyl transferase domain-containing protein